MAASLGILVIRSSLVDWRSMKKECRHARHMKKLRCVFYGLWNILEPPYRRKLTKPQWLLFFSLFLSVLGWTLWGWIFFQYFWNVVPYQNLFQVFEDTSLSSGSTGTEARCWVCVFLCILYIVQCACNLLYPLALPILTVNNLGPNFMHWS
jgi:hypothetical protein